MTERRQQMLPMRNWPKADRRAWNAALHDGGLLGDSGAATHLAPCIKDDFTRRYGYFLNFAARQGSLTLHGPPAAGVTPAMVQAYIAELESYATPVTVHRHLYKMMRVAEYIAPDGSWNWLRRRVRRLAHRARPRDKRSRIVLTGRLFRLGVELMTRANGHDPNADTATLYRDGLMIAVLALCPIRRGNFAALRLGSSIVRLDGGWAIIIPAAENKSRRSYQTLLPDALTGPLDRFVAAYRQSFPDPGDFLWPSRRSGGLSDSRVQQIIAARTKRAFGFAVGPHLFRDCAATTVAIKAGQDMGVVVALFGHRDQRIIGKHYNQAGMIEATRRYHDLLGF